MNIWEKFRTGSLTILNVVILNIFVLGFTLYYGANSESQVFAQYVVTLTIFNISFIALDFGFNISALKERRKYFVKNRLLAFRGIALRVSSLLLLFYLCVTIYLQSTTYLPYVLAFYSAAIYSYWFSRRVCTQVLLNFDRYNRQNFQFLICRILVLIVFYNLGSPVEYGIFVLYGLPSLLSLISKRFILDFKTPFYKIIENKAFYKQCLFYGGIVFLSSLIYTLTFNVPILKAKLIDMIETVAALGWVLAPISAVTIIFSVLRPFWISYTCRVKNVRLPLVRLVIILIATIPILISAYILFQQFVAPLSEVIGVEESWLSASFLAVCFSIILSMVGLASSLLHRLKKPKYDLYFNVIRFLLVIFVFYFQQKFYFHEPISSVVALFGCMIIIEILLALFVLAKLPKE